MPRIQEKEARAGLRRSTWLLHINAMCLVWSLAFLVWDLSQGYELFALAQVLIAAVNALSVQTSWRTRRLWLGVINQFWSK